ncbi:uncharacterized protein [Henckelia pumila]|uniref:uncharacterized protein isoform X2 n=1 Tax=Henckelia pumila TaxID=405737 RepID=UPI003C6DEB67
MIVRSGNRFVLAGFISATRSDGSLIGESWANTMIWHQGARNLLNFCSIARIGNDPSRTNITAKINMMKLEVNALNSSTLM